MEEIITGKENLNSSDAAMKKILDSQQARFKALGFNPKLANIFQTL